MGKRIVAVWLTVIAVLVTAKGTVSAEDFKKYGDFAYIVSFDGMAEIVGYSGKDNEVKIPAEIEKTTVVRIASEAFRSNDTIQSVTIPNSIVEIASNAFADCINLSAVEGGTSLHNISADAFNGTALLNSHKNGDIYIGSCYYAYKGDLPSNASLEIKQGTKGIADDVFKDRENLASIHIPVSVENIGNSAFDNCKNLKAVYYAGSQNEWNHILIAESNGSLLSADIYFTETAEEIHANDFFQYHVNADKEITILKSISDDYPPNTKMTIAGKIDDKKVVNISAEAFSGCSGIVEVVVEKGVEVIGSGAFENCKDLVNIQLPDTVRQIEKNAFYKTGLYNKSSNGEFYVGTWCCGYKGEIKTDDDLKLKDGTVGISDNVFANKTLPLHIWFPRSVKYIGKNAFYQCSGVTGIFYESTKSDWETVQIGVGNDLFSNHDIQYNTTIEKYSINNDKNISIGLALIVAVSGVALIWCVSKIRSQKHQIEQLTVRIKDLEKQIPAKKKVRKSPPKPKQ